MERQSHTRHRSRVPDERFENLRSELAAELRKAREAAGLSQEALALTANVDRTYVSQLERGVANPSLLILSRIAEALGHDLTIALRRVDLA